MPLPPDHHAPLCVNQAKEMNMSGTAAPTPAALTKDQASDLKSHTDRLIQTELALQNATFVRDQAKRHLDQFVFDLQHPKQGV